MVRHSREPAGLIFVPKESRGPRPIGFGGVSQKCLRLPRVEFCSSDDVLYADLADVRNRPSRQGHQSAHRGKDAAILEETPVTVLGVHLNPVAGSVKEGHDGRYCPLDGDDSPKPRAEATLLKVQTPVIRQHGWRGYAE